MIFQSLQSKFISIKYYLEYRYALFRGYINKDCKPLKCNECNSLKLETTNKDYIDNLLCEYSSRCKICGKLLGNWAYGSWEK
jgi:phage FluMu protein Com